MDEDKVLRLISSGRFVVTNHCLERMKERKVLAIDIIFAAKSSARITLQNHGTWRIDGLDSRNNPLTIISVELNGIIIVTVF